MAKGTLCISLLPIDGSVAAKEARDRRTICELFLLVEITWHQCGDWLRGDLTGRLPSGDLDVLVLAAVSKATRRASLTHFSITLAEELQPIYQEPFTRFSGGHTVSLL